MIAPMRYHARPLGSRHASLALQPTFAARTCTRTHYPLCCTIPARVLLAPLLQQCCRREATLRHTNCCSSNRAHHDGLEDGAPIPAARCARLEYCLGSIE